MKWFGESWGAPVCAVTEEAATPNGLECAHGCGHSIRYGDQGVLIPLFPNRASITEFTEMPRTIRIEGISHVAYHLVCLFDTFGIRGVTHG
jgi:hypothetical protein